MRMSPRALSPEGLVAVAEWGPFARLVRYRQTYHG